MDHTGIIVDIVARRLRRKIDMAVKRYPYKGSMLRKCEIVKISGLSYSVVEDRLNRGWTVDRIIATPKRNKKPDKHMCGGKTIQDCLNCKRPVCKYEFVGD